MELQSLKSSQILCAHKPYFLMPGHIIIFRPGKINLQFIVTARMDSKNLAIISFFIIYHVLFIIFHLQ